MQKRLLSLGFDTERPYGPLTQSEQGARLREEQLAFLEHMNEKFDAEGVPRTHFILGVYLLDAAQAVGSNTLRSIFNRKNELIDIQQHSYSHPIFRPIPSRPDREPISAEAFIEDIAQGSDVVEEILGVKPTGLRTPLGYHTDLSDMPEITEGLAQLGIEYVSSDLRSLDSLEAKMFNEDGPRQPHQYTNAPGLIEIPSHGWQDVIFTEEKQKQYFNEIVFNGDEILGHYASLLDEAATIDSDIVHVALCLHPWAAMQYDQELETLPRIADLARSKGFDLASYTDVADTYRELIN